MLFNKVGVQTVCAMWWEYNPNNLSVCVIVVCNYNIITLYIDIYNILLLIIITSSNTSSHNRIYVYITLMLI